MLPLVKSLHPDDRINGMIRAAESGGAVFLFENVIFFACNVVDRL